MQELGITLMSHIAEGLGKPRDYFDSWFSRDTISTLRVIRYLPRGKSDQAVKFDKLTSDEMRFTTPIHTDSGFLTLLSTFGFPGLQVHIGNDEYRSVKPVPNTIVVNLGDMLARISNDQVKSTKHRVLDIGVERYSSPFFFEPYYGAHIPYHIFESSRN